MSWAVTISRESPGGVVQALRDGGSSGKARREVRLSDMLSRFGGGSGFARVDGGGRDLANREFRLLGFDNGPDPLAAGPFKAFSSEVKPGGESYVAMEPFF